ncbi:hypothetical protein B0H63DRAFT_447871 [Podospora didyma]|uniref:Uncharacterized protein n=1 Tax=Podospora didyma TaxID=330526 RepID=A0AAE0NSZ6_9PEZI|nr:hypothetical protein B0H63DRAFT_447871 [Podospora didyma]
MAFGALAAVAAAQSNSDTQTTSTIIAPPPSSTAPATTAPVASLILPDFGDQGQLNGIGADVHLSAASGCVSGITVIQNQSTYKQVMTFSNGDETLDCTLENGDGICVAQAEATIPYSDSKLGTGYSVGAYTMPTTYVAFTTYAAQVTVTASTDKLPTPTGKPPKHDLNEDAGGDIRDGRMKRAELQSRSLRRRAGGEGGGSQAAADVVVSEAEMPDWDWPGHRMSNSQEGRDTGDFVEYQLQKSWDTPHYYVCCDLTLEHLYWCTGLAVAACSAPPFRLQYLFLHILTELYPRVPDRLASPRAVADCGKGTIRDDE